jgi:lysozyme
MTVNSIESLIAAEEGRRHDAYRDTLGVWTIGIGHTGREVVEGLTWDDQQIDGAFFRDVATAHNGLAARLPWLDQLDAVRKAYLISMAFQLGVDGVLGFPKMLAALRDQRWIDAAGSARDSLWHKQTFQRAERCARAFEDGTWQS